MAHYNTYGQQQYYDNTGGSTYPSNIQTNSGVSPTLQPFLTSSTYSLAQAAQQSLLNSQLANQSYQNPIHYQTYQTAVLPQYSSYTIQRPIPSPRASYTESNALWMGDLEPWMDENFVFSLFAHTGEATHAKIIRDKQSGKPSGYGFVYFTSQLAAQKVLENFSNQPIPGTNKVFKLNTAQHGMGEKGLKREFQSAARVITRPPRGDEEVISLFIGDLAPDVTEQYIVQTFQYYYPSVYSAKVVKDPTTGLSKGYGFVYFKDEGEKTRALTEMQGFYLSYRPIRLNLATKKGETKQPVVQYVATSSPTRPQPKQQQQQQQPVPLESIHLGPADPNNTTVFVGGIDTSITHDVLKAFFSRFGELTNVKIPYGKGCAFVEFKDHVTASGVLSSLNNSAVIGNSQVRLSWGRPSAKSSTQFDSPEDVSIEGQTDRPEGFEEAYSKQYEQYQQGFTDQQGYSNLQENYSEQQGYSDQQNYSEQQMYSNQPYQYQEEGYTPTPFEQSEPKVVSTEEEIEHPSKKRRGNEELTPSIANTTPQEQTSIEETKPAGSNAAISDVEQTISNTGEQTNIIIGDHTNNTTGEKSSTTTEDQISTIGEETKITGSEKSAATTSDQTTNVDQTITNTDEQTNNQAPNTIDGEDIPSS